MCDCNCQGAIAELTRAIENLRAGRIAIQLDKKTVAELRLSLDSELKRFAKHR